MTSKKSPKSMRWKKLLCRPRTFTQTVATGCGRKEVADAEVVAIAKALVALLARVIVPVVGALAGITVVSITVIVEVVLSAVAAAPAATTAGMHR